MKSIFILVPLLVPLLIAGMGQAKEVKLRKVCQAKDTCLMLLKGDKYCQGDGSVREDGRVVCCKDYQFRQTDTPYKTWKIFCKVARGEDEGTCRCVRPNSVVT